MSATLDSGSLLDLLEPGWRNQLASGVLAAQLDVEPGLLGTTAGALGEQARRLSVREVAVGWPACVVVVLVRIAADAVVPDSAAADVFGSAWHRAAGLRATRRSSGEWSAAFLAALEFLGIPSSSASAREAVLAHATAPVSADEAGPADESASERDGRDRVRLEPFGRGVLLVGSAAPAAPASGPTDPGDARPALPAEVMDPADPLLAFDENGVPPGPVLPAEPVWLVYPDEAPLRADSEPRVLVTSRLPLTWRGWRLVQLDLRGVSWIGLDEGCGRVGRRHAVRGRTKPVLVTGAPLPGVSAAAGMPVFAKPPEVSLPPGAGGWRVEVRRARSGAVLASGTANGAAWRSDALWRKVPRPLLGEFTITAAAPGRQGLRRNVVVAEGARVTYFPETRLTGPHGLESAEAIISAPPGMTVSPSAVPFAEDTVTRDVAFVAGHVVQHVTVAPPHIRMRIDPEPGSDGEPTPWHHAGPLRLSTADLWHGGALRVDIPGLADQRLPAIEVVTGQGEPAQLLEPTKQGRFPLRRMLDTALANGHTALTITVGTRTVTIATVTTPGPDTDPWAMRENRR